MDLSVEHSSRLSFAGTSTRGYDGSRGEGTNDDSDTGNYGGDIADRQISQYPLSPFTGEDDFTHATQDENHESRRASLGNGAIRKPYRGRKRRMTHQNEDSLLANFKSMSIGTQYSDSSNDSNIFPPNTMSYGQPSSNPSASIDEEYGMINYPHTEQMSFHISYQMQQGFQTNMWVNPDFLSMERLWVQVKTFMHDIFDLIINIIETPYPGMSIVFTKMESLHQMLQ